VNRALDVKVQELRTLFELSKEFNAIFDREKLLKLFTFTLMGQVGAGRYAVCLRNGETVVSRIETKPLCGVQGSYFREYCFANLGLRPPTEKKTCWPSANSASVKASLP